jgi:hypothetical protein
LIPFAIPRVSRLRLLGALAGCALLAGAAPAVAGACDLNTSGATPIFAAFNDQNNYILAPGGTFSAGATGWSLSHAAVVADGAGLAPGDDHSLLVSPGGSATSPPFCIGTSTPFVRFMVRTRDRLMGAMRAYVVWTDWAGREHTSYMGWVPGVHVWTPSIPLFVNQLPLWEPGLTLTVRLRLEPSNGAGTWGIDDVYVDPYSRG